MVKIRRNLEEKDIEALKTFFTCTKFDDFSSDFMKLKHRWISTNEINSELKELYSRTKKRLMRLKQMGFLNQHSVPKLTLTYNFWDITHQGLFCILSTMTEKIEIRKFIVCNQVFVHDFDYIYDLIKSQGLKPIKDLNRQLIELITRYQYHLIDHLIREWFKANFDQNYRLFSFEPIFSIPVKSVKK